MLAAARAAGLTLTLCSCSARCTCTKGVTARTTITRSRDAQRSPRSALTGVHWRKSARSGAGNCVEVANCPAGGTVAVRNSRFPDGPALVYTRSEIEALILGVKDGDFDDLLL